MIAECIGTYFLLFLSSCGPEPSSSTSTTSQDNSLLLKATHTLALKYSVREDPFLLLVTDIVSRDFPNLQLQLRLRYRRTKRPTPDFYRECTVSHFTLGCFYITNKNYILLRSSQQKSLNICLIIILF